MPQAVRVLKLGGKPFSPHQPSPATKIVTGFLDGAPEDELFTIQQIAQKTRLSASHVGYLCRHASLVDYSHQVGRIKYYGNKKAIAELRKQVGA